MKRFLTLFILLSALLAVVQPGMAWAAADCAFEDVNDNGIFDAGDSIVTDAQWIGGVAFATKHPFVVPPGCVLPDLVALPAPLFGVQVTATKITFLGNLNYIPPGGKGVLFIADPAQVPLPAGLGDGSITIGDGVASNVKIEAGGRNGMSLTSIPAVPQKAIGLIAAGACTINSAQLIGNRPIQDTKIGILCNGDITIRQATIRGSKINIQSLTGKIDARSFAAVPGNTLADACDDPALNLVGGGGAPGNNNGILDAGDFPCQINFAALPPSPVFNNAAALLAFCQDPLLVGGRNIFQAFNDPLIMIAKLDLELRGVDGGETEVLGKYRVTLAAEDGNINTAHTFINHGVPPPGGAKIFLFANPASVVRLPVDREDFFGPSTGTIDITSACYESVNNVQVGQDAGGLLNLIGTPDGPPCKQNPGGFVPILNASF
jgi:hypothetical protein